MDTTTNVWEQVQTGLRSFIARRVEDQTAVDDILQDVFIKMHRRMAGLKDPKRVISWVFQITRNAIMDHYRSPKLRREVPAGLAGDVDQRVYAPGVEEAESAELRSELSSCLRPMLGRLSSEYRQAVTLVELDGLTQQAAANQLGLSLSGMKSRVQRGRKQLKQMLEDCCRIELDRRGGVVDYEPRRVDCESCSPAVIAETSTVHAKGRREP